MVRWEEEAAARGHASPKEMLHHFIWVLGWSYRRIAREFGVWTVETIRVTVKRYGVAQPPPGRRRTDDVRRRET